jgi:uncharacterized membrane protein YqjE
MGEILGSLKELLAAVVGHAALYGDAAAQAVQEWKAHWLRRALWAAVGLLLLHAGLIAGVGLAVLSAWHQAWPTGWAWLLCLLPVVAGAAALWHAWRQETPRSLLAEVASEDMLWLRAMVEPPAAPAEQPPAVEGHDGSAGGLPPHSTQPPREPAYDPRH